MEYSLCDHELEIGLANSKRCAADKAAEEMLLSAGVISAKYVSLVGFVVVGIDAMKSIDLVRRQARRRLLTRSARQRFRSETDNGNIISWHARVA